MKDKRYIPLIGIYWCTYEFVMFLETKRDNAKTGENVINYGLFFLYHIGMAAFIAWYYLMFKKIFMQ